MDVKKQAFHTLQYNKKPTTKDRFNCKKKDYVPEQTQMPFQENSQVRRNPKQQLHTKNTPQASSYGTHKSRE